MGEYKIQLDGELESMLTYGAKQRNLSPEDFIVEIINRYLPLTHIINQEEMAKGYAEMSEINLELAK